MIPERGIGMTGESSSGNHIPATIEEHCPLTPNILN